MINRLITWFPFFRFLFPGRLLWLGNYSSWGVAKSKSSGYDSDEIINKVFEATKLVIEGKYAFERDSVLFENPETNNELIAVLQKTKNQSKEVSVLDFGGAMGSKFFQHRQVLQAMKIANWGICEQNLMIEQANKLPKVAGLSFYNSVQSATQAIQPNVLVLGSVLPYVPNPIAILEELLSNNQWAYIYIEKTGFAKSGQQITMQYVPKSIYRASYPCQFLDYEKFVSFVTGFGYTLESRKFNYQTNQPDLRFEDLIFKSSGKTQ